MIECVQLRTYCRSLHVACGYSSLCVVLEHSSTWQVIFYPSVCFTVKSDELCILSNSFKISQDPVRPDKEQTTNWSLLVLVEFPSHEQVLVNE